jgi:hypothetical protein
MQDGTYKLQVPLSMHPKALFLILGRNDYHPSSCHFNNEWCLIGNNERLHTTSKLRIEHSPENEKP